MNNIENTYINYDELISTIGKEVIESRIEQISQEMLDFLEVNELEETAYIHHMALTHAVMDYFSDCLLYTSSCYFRLNPRSCHNRTVLWRQSAIPLQTAGHQTCNTAEQQPGALDSSVPGAGVCCSVKTRAESGLAV